MTVSSRLACKHSQEGIMLTILLVILVLLAIGGLFYRPLGTGYYSYAPSGLFVVIAIILLLFVLGVL